MSKTEKKLATRNDVIAPLLKKREPQTRVKVEPAGSTLTVEALKKDLKSAKTRVKSIRVKNKAAKAKAKAELKAAKSKVLEVKKALKQTKTQ